MPVHVVQEHPGIAEVVIDHPPVNALDVAGWFALADALIAAGRVEDNRVVVLRAEGRGFCAGVDIKEINAKGDEALVGVNRGCAAAFAAVYDCEVPVIAAVQGFCLGGGIGLIGNADIVVASQDATFGLPEVDRGALGAATHLARLVPQHAMRKMVYTAKAISAEELASYGSVAAVVPLADLRAGRAGHRRRDRHQEPLDHPAGQGVAQRHRSGRRQAQLPLRAGLHLRAPRARGGRRAAGRLRRKARGGHVQVSAPMNVALRGVEPGGNLREDERP